MKTILLIDGSHVTHANHNTTKLTVGGLETQAVFGFLRQLSAKLASTPGKVTPLVLWDGRAQFRYDRFSDYKGNRVDKTPEEAASTLARQRQMPIIQMALQFLGVRQMRHTGKEADDLGHQLVNKLAGTVDMIEMLTGDKDWLQNLRPGVMWTDLVNNRECRHDKLFEFTGFRTPEAFVQGKALQGDDTDNCEGIFKLGEKTAQTLLAHWGGDMGNFFKAVDDGSYKPATRKSKTATSKHPEEVLASPEGRALFARNMDLMDLSRAPAVVPGELIQTPTTPSVDKFRLLCQRLAFRSILAREATFLRPFTGLRAA